MKPWKKLVLAWEPLRWGFPWVAAAILELRMEKGERKEEKERKKEKERWRRETAQHRVATKESGVAGNERFRGGKRAQDRKKEEVTRRVRVGIVLTLISLRMTSIMLPITMRKSNTFQGSLKYPYTGWGEQEEEEEEEEEEGKKGRLEGKQHLLLLRSPIMVVIWGNRKISWWANTRKNFNSREEN